MIHGKLSHHIVDANDSQYPIPYENHGELHHSETTSKGP
jgi:hypothetical protein